MTIPLWCEVLLHTVDGLLEFNTTVTTLAFLPAAVNFNPIWAGRPTHVVAVLIASSSSAINALYLEILADGPLMRSLSQY